MTEAAQTGLMISWSALAGVVGVLVVVGPGFYWMGRLSMRVEHNEGQIGVIFEKLDDIQESVNEVRDTQRANGGQHD